MVRISPRFSVAGAVAYPTLRSYLDLSPQGRFAVTIQAGGEGFGWELEPFFEMGGARLASERGREHSRQRLLYTGGLYAGGSYVGRLQEKLFLHLGGGGSLSYGQWHDAGLDNPLWQLVMRSPASVSYYAGPDLALVATASLGVGLALYQFGEFDRDGHLIFAYDVGIGLAWP